MKTPQHFYRKRDSFRRKQPAAKHGLSQACNFAVFMDFDQSMCNQAGDFQAN
jgi:hypothetical protein